MLDKDELEALESDLLLEALYRRYGYDFRNYAQATARRRIKLLAKETQSSSISALTERVLHESDFYRKVLNYMSITVSEMFRDPGFFLALRQKVIPFLKTFPYIKVWHAGCSTGEEVYSLAILLHEEGLYERSTIYATDFNEEALQTARQGIYSVEKIKAFTQNYEKSGGCSSFSDYYHARYEFAIINQALKKQITFANHNLVTDNVFSEVHLLICRNVLIYFNKALQSRALALFDSSLIYGGFLCLGSKESPDFSELGSHFSCVDRRWRIYQYKHPG